MARTGKHLGTSLAVCSHRSDGGLPDCSFKIVTTNPAREVAGHLANTKRGGRQGHVASVTDHVEDDAGRLVLDPKQQEDLKLKRAEKEKDHDRR